MITIDIDPLRFPLSGIGRYAFEIVNEFNRKGIAFNYYFNGKIIPYSEFSLKDHKCNYIDNPINTKTSLLAYLYKFNSLFVNSKYSFKKQKQSTLYSPSFYVNNLFKVNITTIHDLSVIKYPEFHPLRRVFVIKKNIEESFIKSKKIIVSSKFSKDELINEYKIDENRVNIVSPGAGFDFTENNALEKFNLIQNKYFLFYGTIEPRKNIIRMIEAFDLLPKAEKKYFKLVIVGNIGWKCDDIVNLMNKKNYVYYLGRLDDDSLGTLIKNAKSTLFLSLYEGFGLPVVESFSLGTPVIASNTGPMLETGEGLAKFVDPYDPRMIKDAISCSIDQLDFFPNKDALIKRASLFTWSKTSNELLNVFKS